LSLVDFQGVGVGLRRAFGFAEQLTQAPFQFDFLEVAPENWMQMGGRWQKRFVEIANIHPIVCHGLSLSLGGPSTLDEDFLLKIKHFLKRFNVRYYSEHLSYCSDAGHLYDLMPIPFTEEAAAYVATRVRRVQQVLEQRIAIENVSYYAVLGKEMSEQAFLLSVAEQADCDILLDVNNIYVNSVNHGYGASEFLNAIPVDKVAYLHVAGHHQQAADLIVDSHGADVIEPVWQLLQQAYARFGVLPTLLERDFNIPEYAGLMKEVAQIKAFQLKANQLKVDQQAQS
jgi:uncharacterized protein